MVPNEMNKPARALLMFGASGHSKVIIDLVEKGSEYCIKWLADDNPELKATNVYGYKVLGGKDELQHVVRIFKGALAVVAIGSNRARANVADSLVAQGWELTPALIHPSAQIARGVTLDAGTVVMAGVVINSDSHIGRNVIVNTGASVDHDCEIGDAVHIAPHATLCGGITVGAGSLIGAGAVICPNLNIGSNVTVGAGATVINNVADNSIVAGTPARLIGKA